jgi:cation/acetate symporter
MAAPLLANAVGGAAFFGFICAVAFATILAVVAGLTLSGAAALSHDIWVNVVKGGQASEHEQLRVARIAAVILGVCAILLGITFQGQNIAYMVGLTFSIAASANFPALVMAIFWRRFTTWGAVTAIVLGTVSTLVLLYCGPTIQVDILKHNLAEVSKQWWYFPLKNPCLITMTLSFLSGIVVSLLKPEPAAEAGFAEVERRAILGAIPIGPAAAEAAPAE